MRHNKIPVVEDDADVSPGYHIRRPDTALAGGSSVAKGARAVERRRAKPSGGAITSKTARGANAFITRRFQRLPSSRPNLVQGCTGAV